MPVLLSVPIRNPDLIQTDLSAWSSESSSVDASRSSSVWDLHSPASGTGLEFQLPGHVRILLFCGDNEENVHIVTPQAHTKRKT